MDSLYILFLFQVHTAIYHTTTISKFTTSTTNLPSSTAFVAYKVLRIPCLLAKTLSLMPIFFLLHHFFFFGPPQQLFGDFLYYLLFMSLSITVLIFSFYPDFLLVIPWPTPFSSPGFN